MKTKSLCLKPNPAPPATPSKPPSTKVLTPKDIAEILSISYDSALSFIKNSGIEYLELGRQYRVTEDKFLAFLAQEGCISVDLS